jgi:formylglycine-generating enzyme required for sulfatase activity
MKHAIFLLIIAAALSASCGDGLYDAYNARAGSFYAGKKQLFSADGLSFTLVAMSGGATFPMGEFDTGSATVPASYWIGESEVTYGLWQTVYDWAVSEGYEFANLGVGTTSVHPVTNVSWRDCMVWCNALTEWYNAKSGTGYTCVYNNAGNPLRDSTIAAECDAVVPDAGASGFRLPASDEWEHAARYRGNDGANGAIEMPVGSGMFWTPGNYASGATDVTGEKVLNDWTDAVAWFDKNADSTTHEVKTKGPNALGIYDMSGNVHEWCFDLYDAINRIRRGGAYQSPSENLRVGCIYNNSPDSKVGTIGFRISRSLR